MDAADYLRAVDRAGLGLEGRAVYASWDTRLTETMARVDVAIHEEQVLDELLDDLRDDPAR